MFYIYQDKKMIRPVLTSNRGIIPEQEVCIGDKLIEFNTSREIEVQEIEHQPYERLYGVRFTDGREEIFTDKELVYGIKYLFHPWDLMHGNIGWEYHLSPVTFNPSVVKPDVHPYIVGALWAYGDFNYPYINLPKDRVEKNPSILNNMDCDIFGSEGNRCYFKLRGSRPEEPLWWRDLIPHCTWHEDHVENPSIPFEYIFNSYRTRVTFLRGVFDYGYNKDITPDTVSINHWNSDRIHQVQLMLWSLGILNKVYIDSDLEPRFKYRLDIIGKYEHVPTFFNDVEYITQMLSEPNRVIHRTLPEELHIQTVYEIKSGDYMLKDKTPVFITEREHEIYYSGEFLPRVTK